MKIQSKLTSFTLSAFLISLSGCTSTNPYDQPSAFSRPSTAYSTGAATPAMSGKSISNMPGMLVSGATGNATPASGTALGFKSKVGKPDINTELYQHGISVVNIKDETVLLMPSNVHFATGSSQLDPAFQSALNSVAQVMKDYPNVVAEIPGHTDSTGSTQQNASLAQARAQVVANYLGTQGISQSRLIVIPYGETLPVASNESAKGRQLNRRVEIIFHQRSSQ